MAAYGVLPSPWAAPPPVPHSCLGPTEPLIAGCSPWPSLYPCTCPGPTGSSPITAPSSPDNSELPASSAHLPCSGSIIAPPSLRDLQACPQQPSPHLPSRVEDPMPLPPVGSGQPSVHSAACKAHGATKNSICLGQPPPTLGIQGCPRPQKPESAVTIFNNYNRVQSGPLTSKSL
jgi:hypothetical protein